MHQHNLPSGNSLFDHQSKDTTISPYDIVSDFAEHCNSFRAVDHREVLDRLLKNVTTLDYYGIAFPETEKIRQRLNELCQDSNSWGDSSTTGQQESPEQVERKRLEAALKKNKLQTKHYLIITIDSLLDLAKMRNWDICINNQQVYLYNGAYWSLFSSEEIQAFFGKVSEKMGVNSWDAKHYVFREQLFKQFLCTANLPRPEDQDGNVLINLKNGTFVIGTDKQELQKPDPKDFITYQLPFDYDPQKSAPLFQKYLDTVQPDLSRQQILAEYIAYLFVKSSTLKLEKTLLLYGTGANGKSVFFEIINALLGGEANVSSYSLQNLTNDNGYARAMLANKLVNYASEINGKLEASIFKQLVSGEPVEARLPYGKPFTLYNYGKLIFNCNELPKDVEQTNAFFRRFLIIPFEVTIPDSEQDKELAKKIIDNELSGVFNWVLDGLRRLLEQRKFTESEAVNNQLEQYRLQSDSVKSFVVEEGYQKSDGWILLGELFNQYRNYCGESGYHACSKRTFSERLKHAGFIVERKNIGMVIYTSK